MRYAFWWFVCSQCNKPVHISLPVYSKQDETGKIHSHIDGRDQFSAVHMHVRQHQN